MEPGNQNAVNTAAEAIIDGKPVDLSQVSFTHPNATAITKKAAIIASPKAVQRERAEARRQRQFKQSNLSDAC